MKRNFSKATSDFTNSWEHNGTIGLAIRNNQVPSLSTIQLLPVRKYVYRHCPNAQALGTKLNRLYETMDLDGITFKAGSGRLK